MNKPHGVPVLKPHRRLKPSMAGTGRKTIAAAMPNGEVQEEVASQPAPLPAARPAAIASAIIFLPVPAMLGFKRLCGFKTGTPWGLFITADQAMLTVTVNAFEMAAVVQVGNRAQHITAARKCSCDDMAF